MISDLARNVADQQALWRAATRLGDSFELRELSSIQNNLLAAEDKVKLIENNLETGIRYYAALFNTEVTFLDMFRISGDIENFNRYQESSRTTLGKLNDWHNEAKSGEINGSEVNNYANWIRDYDFDYRFARWQVTYDCTVAKQENSDTVNFEALINPERNNYCKYLKWSEFENSYWCSGYANQIMNEIC